MTLHRDILDPKVDCLREIPSVMAIGFTGPRSMCFVGERALVVFASQESISWDV